TPLTPGLDSADYNSYLVPPPNSASSSLASVLSSNTTTTTNTYAASTTTATDDASAWLFAENNLFSSFSDDGMFAFSLPMDNAADQTNNFYYPPQSANSLNPPRHNWSSDSNLSTVFSESVISPPPSRMGSSYGFGGGAGNSLTAANHNPPLSTVHSRPVTSHETLSGAAGGGSTLLSPGLDYRPTSAGSSSLYGAVTLPRPATASFASAGKDLWSATLGNLPQSPPPHSHSHLHVQQQPQIQQQSPSAMDSVMHPTVTQEGSLSMWNAMPAGFVGGAGFDSGGMPLTSLDPYAHNRKWSI
ncbi:hypothetical protein FRB90_002640, partial [Tulasnella sp. 427]